MLEFCHMPEGLRRQERLPEGLKLETLVKVATEALNIRDKFISDATAVAQAMKGNNLNNRPDWKEVQRQILDQLRILRKTRVVHDIPFNRPSKSLKDSLSPGAWERMLADATEFEKLHPADALGHDEEAA